MRIFLVGAIVLILLSPVLLGAEEENQSLNQSISELFPDVPDGLASITPPDIESTFEPGAGAEEIARAAALGEEELNDLLMEIRDIDTGELITDAHIQIYFLNKETTEAINTLRYVGEDGTISAKLLPGIWTVTIELDDLSTPGKDYFSELEIDLRNSADVTAFIQPVGSVMGSVYDSSGNLVVGAHIKFECGADYGNHSAVITDSYGSFSKDWLPVGVCRISARAGSIVGTIDVAIEKGEKKDVQITLEQGVAPSGGEDWTWVLIVVIVIVLILILVVYLRLRKREPSVGKIATGEEKAIRPNKRTEDILAALDETEKRIIEILMSRGGRALQSQIREEIRIPKSTLSRYISALETRNIIETEKLGRINKIKLTDWFLNKK